MNANNANLTLAAKSNILNGGPLPTVIAGPCSAESEEQMLQTAHDLKKDKRVTVFRAGIWKPRTRPGLFEGVGRVGLEWLQTVKQETGLLTACEVANTKHVEEALEYGVDILWVGARTTVNPFSVQEVADALQGVSIPVLVKNPVNPDLQLWVGALERLNRAGITDLGLIHRGFSTHNNKPYRNHPKWETIQQIRSMLPGVPLFTDPSHIAGRRDLLQTVSQQALHLGVDGLMIETHNNPDVAMSDAAQQITPEVLDKLLTSLDLQHELVANNEQLQDLRDLIDRLDNELINVLFLRSDVSKRIGAYKRAHALDIYQANRWSQIVENRRAIASEIGLDPDFINVIYDAIHQHSLGVQNEVFTTATPSASKAVQ
ncbi:bifunctional 3-deoxy-7-phosphoheptulonate synthase/chorismate mutase type II [Pontibacter sp. 172403-2]|uniref:chorismate mutase n=1 Tax=Pontibacter rufus TaxID=2791028 RepID=UPI0018AFBB35|nr:chorismate mutase [Pontibacter sp. 172403-2]MBF9255332.1 bifunctional 3-deoxy-7-phosphoheptulonate synthase/chorismate mutase type II [Pontibacter sp. 172403-2]